MPGGLIAPDMEQHAQQVAQPAPQQLTDRPITVYDANFDIQLRRNALALADELRRAAVESNALQADALRLYANELIQNIVLEGRNAG